VTLLFTEINTSYATVKNIYVLGLSDGFPPYQFKNTQGEATGFDAEVLRLLFQKEEKKVVFLQMNWDDVVGTLMFTNKLDCVGGMEINEVRKKYFDFTSPYYSRKIAVFIQSDNSTIKQLEDLIGKTITGDRHYSLEKRLKKMGIRKHIRIKQTKSKEESIRLLKTEQVVAVIAPKEVGFYLAKKLNIKVKIIAEANQGSPVGIAVKKGNYQLLTMLENRLQDLIKEGEIYKLHQEWLK